MLFNSYEFLLLFVPIVAVLYFLVGGSERIGELGSKIVLISASLLFYSWWSLPNLAVLTISTLFNFVVGYWLVTQNIRPELKKQLLWVGLLANVLLLGFFKYADFVIFNVNWVTSSHISFLDLTLPLGISFFTFQKIAFLVDASKGDANVKSFSDFTLFVVFFPQLVAGPIVHHKEMMPQFAKPGSRRPDFNMIAGGGFLIAVGLTKKTVIADTLAEWANAGYAANAPLGFFPAWMTSLAYAFQLYFDFSGYTDMAIGVALIFNIRLPFNFNSPYKATTIQEFWRRWHMTLTRFLRDYVFVPLGGNRSTRARLYLNLLIVFLVGGIWHGASWMFVIWGICHGVAMIAHRIWQEFSPWRMPAVAAWGLTFLFVNLAWVFFRAPDLNSAMNVLSGMAGAQGLNAGMGLMPDLWQGGVLLAVCFAICLGFPNSNQLIDGFRPSLRYALCTSGLMALGMLFVDRTSTFLYWSF